MQSVAYYTELLVASAAVNASTGLSQNLTRLSFTDTNARLKLELQSVISLHNTILTGYPPQLPQQAHLFYDQKFPTYRRYGESNVIVNQTFVDMVAEYIAAGMSVHAFLTASSGAISKS